jgi:hypothetical protein
MIMRSPCSFILAGAVVVILIGLTPFMTVCIQTAYATELEKRQWTDSTGKYKLQAEFVTLSDGIVQLKMDGGRIVSIPLTKLSKQDQNFVHKLLSEVETAKESHAKETAENAPARRAMKDSWVTNNVSLVIVGHKQGYSDVLAEHLGYPGLFMFAGSKLGTGMGTFSGVRAEGPQPDKPGSLWLVASGGVTAKGTRLREGMIYVFDEQNKPRATEGAEYSFWVEFAERISVWEQNRLNSRELRQVLPGDRIRILLPGTPPNNWHKVAIPAESGKEIVGWITAEKFKDIAVKRSEPMDLPPSVPRGADESKEKHQDELSDLDSAKLKNDTAVSPDRTEQPAELIVGKWVGKHASKNLRGELDEWEETYDFDISRTFMRILKRGSVTATSKGKYRIIDDMSLETQIDGLTKTDTWKMAITKDTLVLSHTIPDQRIVGGGTSKLTRLK